MATPARSAIAAATSATALDRLIGWINPAAGLRRIAHRQMLTRAYESASPRDSWRPRRAGASANADHAADATILRQKARALEQNVPYVRAALDGIVSYTIGTGIVSRAKGTTRDADILNTLLQRWYKVCDADGRLDWFGLQEVAARTMERDGEVLIRLRPRRPEDGLPIPLQLQLLEIDWLDSTRHGAVEGRNCVNGIAYDALGRVDGYYLFDAHPGEITSIRRPSTNSRFVPARSLLHLYAPDRPGQGRGITRLAPVIARVRDLQLCEDAELARKNLESRLGIVASGDVSQMTDRDPATGVTESEAAAGSLGDLPGGGIVRVPDGLNITAIEPKAAPGHVETVKHHLHIIASGMGVPYALMSGDVADANYSSSRVAMMNFKRGVTARQWLTIIPRLVEPVMQAAGEAARLAGQISRVPAFDHSPPRWEYINPEQDVASDMLEIAAGLTSWSEKMRQRGYTNPDEAMAEVQSDFTKLGAAGILPVMLALQGKATEAASAQAGAAPTTTANQPARTGR